MDMIFNGKAAKAMVIVALITTFLFLLFPIFSVFFENTTTSQIITGYGYEGISVYEGGNNYLEIPDNDDTEEILKNHLKNSGLWHASIDLSNAAQIKWYMELSKQMEKTYVEGTKTKNSINTKSEMNSAYRDKTSCNRIYDGDYANEECDYNGPVTNNPYLVTEDDIEVIKTCENGNIYKINGGKNYLYYKSSEKKNIVGGKILGLYPDVLVSIALANTYSTLDQNDVVGSGVNKTQGNTTTNFFSNLLSGSGILGLLTKLLQKLLSWYSYFENVASANEALKDTFDEGSLYSTFIFAPESKCKTDDLIWYVESDIPEDYTCDLGRSIYTAYEEYKDCDDDGNCETKCKGTSSTNIDGEGKKTSTKPYPGPYSYYVDIEGGKHCLYKTGSDGKTYKLDIKWICNIEKPVFDIKCTSVKPVKDEEGTIHYYLCESVDESEVRSKIVDPILDKYENNELDFNKYMTKISVNQYIYGFEKEKYQNKINPKDFKIDEETRKIITKHVVMEILGRTEGRNPAIADKDGNFYLQSINRVLNTEQFEESLLNTLFVKDNILRKQAEEKSTKLDESKMYSEKLYGIFYSKYNHDFDDWTLEEIETQKIKDQAAQKSLIMEIFSTYEYVTYYLKEYDTTTPIAWPTTGSGVAQIGSDGFKQRVEAPSYSGYWSEGLYGECPWYAKGRVKEILANAGSDYNWTYGGDGGSWCDSANTDKDNFKVSRNYLAPKPGAIVSWKDITGSYGHVAIVEEVTPTTVTISESFIKLGIYGAKAREIIYKDGYNHSAATRNCSKNGCWQRRTLTYEQMRTAGWNNYRFQCYIYLLKDDDTPTPDNNNPDNNDNNNQDNNNPDNNDNNNEDNNKPNDNPNDLATYIVNEFKKGDGIEAKVNFYNYVTATEGGSPININMINSSYLGEEVSVTGTIENYGYASVDPGLYVGTLGETKKIQINGKTYSFELCDGCKIPRWVALYTWLETYNLHRNKVLEYIKETGLEGKINTQQIHAFMRITYTYGPYGDGAKRVKEMLNAYKTGGKHDVWCVISKNVYGSVNNAVHVIGNYFNMNEMIFDLFATGIYGKSPEYRFKYYTVDMVNKLLNSGYPKYGTGYLESALKNGNIPEKNAYSDCN